MKFAIETTLMFIGVGLAVIFGAVATIVCYAAIVAIPFGVIAVIVWWLFGPMMGIR